VIRSHSNNPSCQPRLAWDAAHWAQESKSQGHLMMRGPKQCPSPSAVRVAHTGRSCISRVVFYRVEGICMTEAFHAQPLQQPDVSAPPRVGCSALGSRVQVTRSSDDAWPYTTPEFQCGTCGAYSKKLHFEYIEYFDDCKYFGMLYFERIGENMHQHCIS
jgi:hypothetical protein